MVWAAALALLSAQPVENQAFYETGNTLHAQCADRDIQVQCHAFILGALYSATTVEELVGIKPVCVPSGVTNGQMVDIVLAYIRDNPTQRHLPGPQLILMARAAAFPCKKS